MKIIIKKKIPTSLSINPKHKPKYKTIDEIIKIPDELVDKTIAVIDELLDRTYNDWEESGWTGTDFPLVPFPFFKKNRLPENIGIDDYWISYWLDTNLYKTIKERAEIIDILNDLGAMEEIKHHPVININAGIFDGDQFDLSIDKGKMISIRKLIIEKQQGAEKQESKKESKPTKIEITNMPELKVKGLDSPLTKKKKRMNENILYLNKVGVLYREPKAKYCYEIGEKSDRHKIVRFLTENRGYQSTRLIAVELGNKNEKSLRTEIGKIRGNIKNGLNIDGKDLLQGKKGSGYRINPKYKIIFKNE